MQASQFSQPRWYVIQSKPRQAERAQVNLERQGYEIDLPRLPSSKPAKPSTSF